MRHLLLSLLLVFAGRLAADTKTLYDFESGTDGFNGKTATSPIGATSGKSALELDTTNSSGWNQNLAILTANADWTNAVEIQMDVTVPKGLHDASEYIQLIPVFSGEKDGFYQTGKVDLQDGLNKVAVKVNGAKILTPWKFYLVVNSGKPIPGKIYIDNIRMHSPGRPGTLNVHVTDQAGQPVANAVVAAGTVAAHSDAQGLAQLKMSGDPYPAEVLGAGLESQSFTANVPSGSTGEQNVTVKRIARPKPVAARAWVQADKPGVAFDGQRIYGQNMAMWSGLDPFTNPVQIQKLKAIRSYMIRIPGGEYGNRWDWRTGAIKKLDKDLTVEWTPEATWPVWKKFMQNLGPQAEALLILNSFYSTPEEQVAWIRDARESGIKVRYVELANEPDLFPERYFQGEQKASTDVAKFVKGVVPFARAVRKAFPDIKILGPTTAQLENSECIGESPWLCAKYDDNGNILDDPAHEYWIKKFLRLMSKEGDLIDGIAVHSYPYYPRWKGQTTDVWDAKQAFSKVAMLRKYMGLYKQWLKEYYPAKASRMDIALTEYHVQVAETWVTADVPGAVFVANFLAEFIKDGGTIASGWDINTMKVGDGGGHGMLDPNNDPTEPYAERAKYWAYKIMANNFTGELVPAVSNNPKVAVYAAKDRNRTSVLVINQDPTQPYQVTIQASGVSSATKLRSMTLDTGDYLWSKVLYRAVVNEDPTQHQKVYAAPALNKGWRVFAPVVEPMSVSLYALE